jgi:ketosteroid isomerase-like protein
MSQENIELARLTFDAFNRTFGEGSDDLYEILDANVEWVPITALLDGSTYRGHDGVRQWIDDLKADWEEFQTSWEDFLELGDDRVLSLGRWRARGRGSGVELDFQKAAWLLHIRDGKIVRLKTFTDRKDAFREVGLSE